MAKVNTSTWDPEDLRALEIAGVDWGIANQNGDQSGMERAHEAAELIRAKYGYTGGADGSNLQELPKATTPAATTGGTKQPIQTQSTTPAATQNNQYSQWTPIDNSGIDYDAMYITDPNDLALLQQLEGMWGSAKTPEEQRAIHDAVERIRLGYNYSGGEDGSQYIPIPPTVEESFSYGPAPTYTDDYSARIDEMLNKILNRDAFSYDATTDPLYQQYSQQYQREGQRAMKDTLGQVSARTGGMASSYATTAAQQANQFYAGQLADKIPELYQLAYSMYLDDIDLQVQDLGLLQGASDTQYNRYRDTMSDWRDDRDFAYGQYRDDIADDRYAKEWVYNAGRDNIGDWQWKQNYDRGVFESDRDYDYTTGRDKIDDGRYSDETAYDRVMDLIKLGQVPDDDMLAKAGISREQAENIIAAQKIEDDDGVDDDTGKKWSDGMVDNGDYYTDPNTGINHPKEVYGKDLMEYSDAAGNYQEVAAMAADIYGKEGRTAAINYLDEALKLGALNATDYSQLKKKYRDMK